MDTISHALAGALIGHAAQNGKGAKKIALVGTLAALAPDLDVLITSGSDPLLNLEFHRHFSHSFFFMPLGAALVAGLFFWVWRRQLPFSLLFWVSLAGYFSGIFLDLCTTYGTRIFWPFSYEKYSLNVISIVDPFFTLPLLIFWIWGWKTKQVQPALWGLGFMALYFSLGGWQHSRAMDLQAQLAQERGHQMEEATVKPSFGNLLVWRSIYLDQGEYQVDALRPGLFGADRVYPGERAAKFVVERDLPNLAKDSVLYQDIQRFTEFSQGYLIWHPTQPKVIGDARYAMLPDEVAPLWGITIWPQEPSRHAEFENFRVLAQQRRKHLPQMIAGGDLVPSFDKRPLAAK